MSIIANITSTIKNAMATSRDIQVDRFEENGVEMISASFKDREDIMVIAHVDPNTAKQSINVIVFDLNNEIIGQMIPSLINQIYADTVGLLVDALHKEIAKKPLQSSTHAKMRKISMLNQVS